MAAAKRPLRNIKPRLEALDERVTPSTAGMAHAAALNLRAQALLNARANARLHAAALNTNAIGLARAAVSRPASAGLNLAAAPFQFANRSSLAIQQRLGALRTTSPVTNTAFNASNPGVVFNGLSNPFIFSNSFFSPFGLTNPAVFLNTGLSSPLPFSNAFNNPFGFNAPAILFNSNFANPFVFTSGFNNPSFNFANGLSSPFSSVNGFNNPSLFFTSGLVNPFVFPNGFSTPSPSLVSAEGSINPGLLGVSALTVPGLASSSLINGMFSNGLGGSIFSNALGNNGLTTLGANPFANPSLASSSLFSSVGNAAITNPFSPASLSLGGPGIFTSGLTNFALESLGFDNMANAFNNLINGTGIGSTITPFSGSGIGENPF